MRTPPNNGMNRTRNSVAFMLNHAGSPVIPGVRSPERGGLMRGRFHPAALSQSNKRLNRTRDTAAFRFLRRCGLAGYPRR